MSAPKCFKELGISEAEYFLTGSRALDNEEINYKISSETSDYDYVVNIHRRQLILAYLNNRGITVDYSNYNGGFKFKEDDKTYNIITTIDIEFMAWREALSILQHLIKTDEQYRKVISDKNMRYCIYEQLRGLVKALLNYK